MAHWLNTHPDAWVITDAKHDNIKAIKHIIQTYPKIKPQLINNKQKIFVYTINVSVNQTTYQV